MGDIWPGKNKLLNGQNFTPALLTSGLVKKIKHSSWNQQIERRLIQVQGKPVSETIIEERR
ncbi:hypothetical protein QUB63_34600 [Microcoleus sp. ARI1-B5]|uniref:hypothetical protein n=1 Tax=unclassified Microcoleus TaxID=2642155 RepID=UPI002FD56FB1